MSLNTAIVDSFLPGCASGHTRDHLFQRIRIHRVEDHAKFLSDLAPLVAQVSPRRAAVEGGHRKGQMVHKQALVGIVHHNSHLVGPDVLHCELLRDQTDLVLQ